MYKQLLQATVKIANLNTVRNYARSAGILRSRYYKRKPDHSRYEYNETITIIPPEYAEQDEYISEKAVGKFYTDKHKQHRQRFFKRASVLQIEENKKSKEEIECEHDRLFTKRSTNDLPISDIEDPYKKALYQCIFCKYNIELDYKNTQLLSQFVSPITGLLLRHEITGLCWPKYAELEKTLKKSRDAGLMPYRYKSSTYIFDPTAADGVTDQLKDIPNVFPENNNNKS